MTFPFPIICPSQLSLSGGYVESVLNNDNSSTYRFTGANIGIPAYDRLVVVAVTSWAGTSYSITGCTLGGVAMREVCNSTHTDTSSAIYSMMVPTGSTADIVVTNSNTRHNCAIHIYAVYGRSNDTEFHKNTGGSSGSTVNTASTTINYKENGIVIGCGNERTFANATWTNLTEDYDTSTETCNTAAHKLTTTAVTGETISINFSASYFTSIAVASWSPE